MQKPASFPVRQPASRTNKLLQRMLEIGGPDIAARCEEVPLVFEAVMAVPGEELSHAYFPTLGYVSLISVAQPDEIQVGLVGDEGMLGIGLTIGVAASNVKAVVQGAGVALRLSGPDLTRALKGSLPLQVEMARYAHYVTSEYVQAAACNRFHSLESRFARWLLMTANRAHSESFCTTQRFIAVMLGVRRVSVTGAAVDLHERRLIDYRRGHLRIIDRPGLEKMACSCYRRDQAAFHRLGGGELGKG